MGERHPGVWVGIVLMVVGLVMALLLTKKDAFALLGAGLIVAGGLAIAISYEDASEE